MKLPAREYWNDVGTAGGVPVATRNQPCPWIATSSTLPVDWIAPVPMRLSMEPSCTPRPTWAAFVPPCVPLVPEPPRWIWLSESRNVVRADL